LSSPSRTSAAPRTAVRPVRGNGDASPSWRRRLDEVLCEEQRLDEDSGMACLPGVSERDQ
jgi:hypothetical protein